MWKPVFTPLSGYDRPEASRPSLNEKTRVVSAANATAMRSINTCTCSSNESGTPIGASGNWRSSPLAFRASMRWIRRSISRMLSRYSFKRARSVAPISRRSVWICAVTQSRMLLSVRRLAARSSGVAPTPNSWSNTTRGSRTIGSGCVGEAQLIVSV